MTACRLSITCVVSAWRLRRSEVQCRGHVILVLVLHGIWVRAINPSHLFNLNHITTITFQLTILFSAWKGSSAGFLNPVWNHMLDAGSKTTGLPWSLYFELLKVCKPAHESLRPPKHTRFSPLLCQPWVRCATVISLILNTLSRTCISSTKYLICE